MKKLSVLIPVILFCLSGISRDLGTSWIVTGEGKMECKKLNVGPNKAHVILENGQKKSLSLNEITSYSLNGRVFDRLPLYENGKPIGQSGFMEFIKECYGYKLYRYAYYDTGLSSAVTKYFLYDGNRLHLALDEEGLTNICKHFEIVEKRH